MTGPGTIGIFGHSQDFFIATGKKNMKDERKKKLQNFNTPFDSKHFLCVTEESINVFIYF